MAISNLDKSALALAAAEARNKVTAEVADEKLRLRWLNAINKAYKLMIQPTTAIYRGRDVQGYSDGVIVLSSQSGKAYHVTRTQCACEAFTNDRQPCWHRASVAVLDAHDMKVSRRLEPIAA